MPPSPPKSAQTPYQDLHIYYLEGELGPISPPGPGYLGTWVEEGYSFIFFNQTADQTVNGLIQNHPQVALVDRYEMSYEQWQGSQPAPMDLGSFVISPPWDQPANEPAMDHRATGPARHELILDPGVVFGTGTHATTRDCLEALEAACDPHPPDRVLDLGTGTGVLAMAAAKLGCPRVLAVDNNFLAVQTTLANIRFNGMENQVLAVQGSAEALLHNNVDLLVANIHFDVMVQIINTSAFAASKRFILSGLMRSEAREIADRLRQHGARMIKTWERDSIWHTFYGEIS